VLLEVSDIPALEIVMVLADCANSVLAELSEISPLPPLVVTAKLVPV